MFGCSLPFPSATAAVPRRLCGVWSRTLLTTAGHLDDTSTVFWLQTDSLFGDLRLPAGIGATATDELLLSQISFCGHTVAVEEEDGTTRCSWFREADFGSPFLPGLVPEPPGGAPDVARLTWKGEDVLWEVRISSVGSSAS